MTRARLGALLLALVVGLASCASGEGEERARRVPADPSSSASALRVRIDGLLREHVFWVVLQTENALTRQIPSLRGAGEAFDQHAIALGELFNTYYGSASRDRFLKFWRAYSTAVISYTARLAAGARNDRQRRQLDRAREALSNVSLQLGQFAGSLTPVLSSRGISVRMEDVIARLRTIVELQIKKDYGKADAELRTAFELVDHISSALAVGIAADLPTLFIGAPASTSASYRTLMTATLREHVWLLSLVTENMLTAQPVPQQGAQAALDANTSALAIRLGSIYGKDFEAALAPLWKRHIDLVVAYASAGSDQAKRDKAAADLTQFGTDFGTFLQGANDRLTAAQTTAFFTVYIEKIRAIIDAQAKGDFPAAGGAVRGAADHMDALVAPLVAASVVKFPAKFL